MTQAEELIVNKLREAIEDDNYEPIEAVIHVANTLGLAPARVGQVMPLLKVQV